ncbi:MAG: hypothetical protein LBD79_11070 [Treponema sp.]|jgi:hypothetical protein|nr:hypothetical protein [Treponema sp.]
MTKWRSSPVLPVIQAGLLLIVAVATPKLAAQELSLEELLPALREQAIVIDIVARLVDNDREEIWNSANSKVTIPGRPVGLQLVGTNILVIVQFTPYLRPDGNNVLVAQGQIWIDVPNMGITYQTSLQTIPLEFGEQVYFFPLGTVASRDEAHIEIQLALRPYLEQKPKETAPDATTNPATSPESPKAPS